TYRPEVPAALARLVERMLAKAPDQRPASAGTVAEELAAFTAGHDLRALLKPGRAAGTLGTRQAAGPGESTVVRPPVGTGRRPRPTWRALAAAGAVVVVLIGLGLWVAGYFGANPAPDRGPEPPRGKPPAEPILPRPPRALDRPPLAVA